MNIAFFDFDGTITSKDSLINFIQFAVGKPQYYWGLLLLSPMLTAYAFKFLPNHMAKEKLLAHYFKGWDIQHFEQIANQYALEALPKIIRPQALEAVLKHQQQGDDVVVVSASVEQWLQAWCDKYSIKLIATKLEVKQGKLTGQLATKNCYGAEKVHRIKHVYHLETYDYIYAYGDSKGDKEMLNLADKSHMKPFH